MCYYSVMTVQTIPEISKMTSAQKIELMEELWREMSERDLNDPPDWHREYLADRERALASGEDSFVSIDELEDEIRGEL